jgi:hypothetical protein
MNILRLCLEKRDKKVKAHPFNSIPFQMNRLPPPQDPQYVDLSFSSGSPSSSSNAGSVVGVSEVRRNNSWRSSPAGSNYATIDHHKQHLLAHQGKHLRHSPNCPVKSGSSDSSEQHRPYTSKSSSTFPRSHHAGSLKRVAFKGLKEDEEDETVPDQDRDQQRLDEASADGQEVARMILAAVVANNSAKNHNQLHRETPEMR